MVVKAVTRGSGLALGLRYGLKRPRDKLQKGLTLRADFSKELARREGGMPLRLWRG